MNKIKLRDLQYQIKGNDSIKPLADCLQAIAIGLTLPLIISLIIYFADKIDSIDSFGQAFTLISIAFILIGIKLYKHERK